MGHKPSKFGFGLLLGTIIGGALALLISPRTGKENREFALKKIAMLKRKMDDAEITERVNEIFGSATEESTKLFIKAKEEIASRIDDLKDKYGDLDEPEAYTALVEDVLKTVQDKLEATSDQVARLKKYFTESDNA